MTLPTRTTPGNTDWFVRDRFGLFIHWGLYALPARHEWIKMREEIPEDVYNSKYFEHFDPDLYDPEQWADVAAQAGMKYFVITTKHHEGFCLWDSDLTDYKAPNTPAGRDLLRPMVEAFRSRGLGVGFYHSLIDWHHPEFPVDGIHPMRNREDAAEINEERDVSQYAEYLRGQVGELLTDFGQIDIMWLDFSYPDAEWAQQDGLKGKGREDWESEKLYEIIRDLEPEIILNDRLDLDEGWDIKTPEQYQPREWVRFEGEPVVWEACQTFSGSWGYHREEASWKSVGQLVRMLIDTVSKGGNLLLNVGPTGRGEFDARAMDRLRGMGNWMHHHERAIYGCTQAPEEFVAPKDCRLTYNPDTNRMYVHVFAWPFKQLFLDGFAGKVKYAQLLNDASEVSFDEPEDSEEQTLVLNLPVRKPDVTVPVVELYMK
jgi:alpha-L-fucosidase